MIRIHPDIEFDAKCPADNMHLDIAGVVIPGMRCLADASCPSCGNRYYFDLPIGHAIRSPISLKQITGEIYGSRNVFWFSSLLKNAFENKDTSNIVPTIHKMYDSDRIVIVNCLDFLYGHSLLKLLNVQRYLDNFPDLGCCVLVPSQLTHLVPDGVAEIWEFPIPVQDGWKWYHSLQSWMNNQLLSRRECFLSRAYSHPSNRVYDLSRFVRNLPDISHEINLHHPIILFSYREDRLWGRNLVHQQKNIQKLYDYLGSILPEMSFVIIGFGKKSKVRGNEQKVIDLRCDKFDREQDLLWMSYMQRADCVIGVHGSNMLLPSGLAKTTVELIPRPRLGNSVQDFLFSPTNHDNRDSLLFYRLLYGNDDLSNILPSSVADIVVSLLSSAQQNSLWFKVGEEDGAINKASTVSDSALFESTKQYSRRSLEKSFIKRKVRQIAQRILEIVD